MTPSSTEKCPTVDNDSNISQKECAPIQRKTVVRFSHINIRYYNTVLGVNPSCSSGPPLSLGWECQREESREFLSLDDENDGSNGSSSNSNGICPVVSRSKREMALRSLGYSQSEVAASVRGVLKAKRQRRRSYHNQSDWNRLESKIFGEVKKGKIGPRLIRYCGVIGNKGRKGKDLPESINELDTDQRDFGQYFHNLLKCDENDVSDFDGRVNEGTKDDECPSSVESDVSCSDDDALSTSSISVDDSHDGDNTHTDTAEASKAIPLQRAVRFSEVHVRYYDTILGDHPCCSGGPPVSLGWYHEPEDDIIPLGDIDDECKKKEQVNTRGGDSSPLIYDDEDDELMIMSSKTNHCPTLSRASREEMLRRQGYKQSAIAKAIRSMHRVKKQRRQTYHNLYTMPAEEIIEGTVKSVVGGLLRSNKMYDISEYLEEFHTDSGSLLRSMPSQEGTVEEVNESVSKTSITEDKDDQSYSPPSDYVCVDDGDDAVEIITTVEVQQEPEKDTPASDDSIDQKVSSKPSSHRSREQLQPVRFDAVHIRDYDMEVGDNPSTTSPGAALTIGWNYKELDPINVDSFEESRGSIRYKSQDKMRFSQKEREGILLECGFTMSELHKASLSIRKVKNQRKVTLMNSSNAVAEERREKVSRAVQRTLGIRKSGAREIKELWVQAQSGV